jgi:hypothetical protein
MAKTQVAAAPVDPGWPDHFYLCRRAPRTTSALTRLANINGNNVEYLLLSYSDAVEQ